MVPNKKWILGICLCIIVLVCIKQFANYDVMCSYDGAGVEYMRWPFPWQRKRAVNEQNFDPMSITINRIENFDYEAAMQKLNEAKVSQDDPLLVQLIRDYYLVPPSTEPYNLRHPNWLEYSGGQTPYIDSRLNYMEGGFYVECGALDGERASTSLFFEKVRKWNGLLVEADPENFAALKSKHRKAFIINACLNTDPYPAIKTFNKHRGMGRLAQDEDAKQWFRGKKLAKREVKVQCFPLYSILLALNMTKVDYLNLDIEGDELKVLKTIPFDKVDIEMMTVEFINEADGGIELKKFVNDKGYDLHFTILKRPGGPNDYILGKKREKIRRN